MFAFHRPNHVALGARVDLDIPLLESILKLGNSQNGLPDALLEFCSANSDSPAVPEHIELVMAKSAFERLLGIGQKVDQFVTALQALVVGNPLPHGGPMESAWRKHRPAAKRPLEAWAREFCDIRGSSAHGKNRQGDRFAWTLRAHLAFVSLLFPLIVKKRLASEGLLKMDSYDMQRLGRIEDYLMHDPFDYDWFNALTSHPWSRIETNALLRSHAHLFYGKATSTWVE